MLAYQRHALLVVWRSAGSRHETSLDAAGYKSKQQQNVQVPSALSLQIIQPDVVLDSYGLYGLPLDCLNIVTSKGKAKRERIKEDLI